MGDRNWPECGQSCSGCTFLALSGPRMTHSRAKPLKAFPSSDLEICPTQQVTKTQLQASSHKIAFITFCSSLFPSRFLPPVVLGLGHPGAKRTKVSLPGQVTVYMVGLTHLPVDSVRRAASSALLSPSTRKMSSLQGSPKITSL